VRAVMNIHFIDSLDEALNLALERPVVPLPIKSEEAGVGHHA